MHTAGQIQCPTRQPKNKANTGDAKNTSEIQPNASQVNPIQAKAIQFNRIQANSTKKKQANLTKKKCCAFCVARPRQGRPPIASWAMAHGARTNLGKQRVACGVSRLLRVDGVDEHSQRGPAGSNKPVLEFGSKARQCVVLLRREFGRQTSSRWLVLARGSSRENLIRY
jgi:hypothetical protein